MRSLHRGLIGLALALLAAPAGAVDGVIENDQARALAGGVTPNDQPGFPVTIGQAGSYRLTGNLSLNAGQPDTDAIAVVTSNGVVIDLNGFALEGPSSCTPPGPCAPAGSGHGVNASGGPQVTVRNGSVRGFPGGGVLFGSRARVEDVSAFNNGGTGIQVGANCSVRDCIAGSNLANGILSGASAVIEGCSADLNGQHGIQTSLASVITRNTAAGNALNGIAAGATSSVQNNSARDNHNAGISCGGGCTVIGNTAHDNDKQGLVLDADSGYAQNALRQNNGGNDQAQVLNGVDFGQNICGAAGQGNGIACP